MEKNAPRNTMDDKVVGKAESDFEFYLTSGLPSSQIIAVLKAQKNDQKEIDAFMAKYETSKKRVRKLVKKFVEKIEQQYGHLDVPELMRKGIKFASKHDFTPAEVEAFKRFVLTGDTEGQFLPMQELGLTDMSKFLGFSTYTGQLLDIKATDQRTLDEIVRKFTENRFLHTSLKNQLVNYRDCAPEAVTGKYNKTKDNVSMFIHPVIAMLFLPKIDCIDKRMLYTNFGRLVAHRAQPYIRHNQNLSDTYLKDELESDYALAYDIARDPNSLAYFSEDKPITNLLKRFNIQIKLWHNVMNLRQGRYYSKGEYETDDGITGLVRTLNSYDWSFFDSPELYQVQDEGTIIRKLLAVFSYRPTFTQISPFVQSVGMGYSNLGSIARTTFINTPMINIRLPTNIYGTTGSPVDLSVALQQADHYIENKMLVPKRKSVIYSRDVAFFYANRKYHSVNFANMNMGFNYVAMPMAQTGITSINDTPLNFRESGLKIGNDSFDLRSVVVLQTPPVSGSVPTGCSAIVIKRPDFSIGQSDTVYYHYNPQDASILMDTGSTWESNDPITSIPENSADPNDMSFRDLARRYGTIYLYVKA